MIKSYLKIFGAMLMISPLIFAFFGLDYGATLKTFLITSTIVLTTTLLGIVMLNYLEAPYKK